MLPIAGRFVREDGFRGDDEILAWWSPRLNIVLILITKAFRSRGTSRGSKWLAGGAFGVVPAKNGADSDTENSQYRSLAMVSGQAGR